MHKDSTSAKAAEADALMAKAAKALKTTLFTWRVDHAAVADSYEAAAQLYTSIDNVAAARQAWQRAAHQRVKAHDTARAARCLASLASYLQSRATSAHTMCVRQARDRLRSGGSSSKSAEDALRHEASTYYMEAANVYKEAAQQLLANGDGARAAQHLALAARAARDLVAHEQSVNGSSRKSDARSSGSKDNSDEASSSNSSSSAWQTVADALYRQLACDAIAASERAWEVGESGAPYALPDLYHDLTLYLLRSGDAVAAVQAMKRSLGIVTTTATTATSWSLSRSSPSPLPSAGDTDSERYVESKNVYMQLRQPANAAKTALEIVIVCLAGDVRGSSSSKDNDNNNNNIKNKYSNVMHSSMGDRLTWAHRELNVLRGVGGFAGSSEQVAANALLAAYDERDAEQLAQTLRDCSCLRFVRAEVSRMATQLRIDGVAASNSNNSSNNDNNSRDEQTRAATEQQGDGGSTTRTDEAAVAADGNDHDDDDDMLDLR